MRKFVRFLIKVILSLFYRVQVSGRENLPSAGAVILCANHISDLDMFFIGIKIKRFVCWMAKEELFKVPLMGGFIKFMGAFPIKRGKGDIGSIKTALGILEEGKVLGIFPEGTRTKGKNKSSIRIKPGITMLAARSGAQIIPVGISGTYKLFSKVKIHFGKPFSLEIDSDSKLSNQEMSEISKGIMDKVYKLLEE